MRLLFGAFFLITLQAQVIPSNRLIPLQQVKQFLVLSDSQVQAILTNNDDYNRWSSEKQTRIFQVQSEIAEETAKEPLDPNALGIRYAEIETICRQMRDRAREGRAKNVQILSADQQAKLKVLEQAVALAPAISEAQYGNLLGQAGSAPSGFTGASGGVYGGSILGISTTNGCQAQAARWFDTSEFVREPIPQRP